MRAAPGPLFPGGVALLFRGISKTLLVSVREELVVAANDLPVKVHVRITEIQVSSKFDNLKIEYIN